jgi:ABC-type lipoprotein export system ATPase subunit
VSAAAAGPPLCACRGLNVCYGRGDARVDALADVDLEIVPGDALALWGPSGSGKTTLLHALGGLVAPTRGRVEWEGRPLSPLDVAARARGQSAEIALVFQNANLLPHFTAIENVAFAAQMTGSTAAGRGPLELLGLVGMAAKADHLPAELSGGEAQRTAIARALAQGARLVLCDEPTGQLDSDTADRVLDLIQALHRELGFALIVATHDPDVAARLERGIELIDGRVVHSEVHR